MTGDHGRAFVEGVQALLDRTHNSGLVPTPQIRAPDTSTEQRVAGDQQRRTGRADPTTAKDRHVMTMIGVYADWEGIDGPLRLGWLHAKKTRSTEKFEYESDPLALQNRALSAVRIDPDNRAPEGRE